MDWVEFLHQFAHHVLPAVPWLVAGACVAMVSLGPVGRAISQRLRVDDTDNHVIDRVMEEVFELRSEVGYMAERLDVHERALALRDRNRQSGPNGKRSAISNHAASSV